MNIFESIDVARCAPFIERARAVITPETESSTRVEDLDHDSRDITTISKKKISELLQIKNHNPTLHP
jgi:hypothetical protein